MKAHRVVEGNISFLEGEVFFYFGQNAMISLVRRGIDSVDIAVECNIWEAPALKKVWPSA